MGQGCARKSAVDGPKDAVPREAPTSNGAPPIGEDVKEPRGKVIGVGADNLHGGSHRTSRAEHPPSLSHPSLSLDDDDSDTMESKLTGLPTVMISINDKGEGGDSKSINSSSVFPSEDLPVLGSIQVVT